MTGTPLTDGTESGTLTVRKTDDISSNGFAFDYAFTADTTPGNLVNTDENRPADSEVNAVIRAVGTDTAQWVSTPFKINEGNANNITVVAPLERNYAP